MNCANFIRALLLTVAVGNVHSTIICDDGSCGTSSTIKQSVSSVLPWITTDKLIIVTESENKQPPQYSRCRLKENTDITYGILIQGYCFVITSPIDIYTGFNSVTRWSSSKIPNFDNEFLENVVTNIATSLHVRDLYEEGVKILVINNEAPLIESLKKHSIGNIRGEDELYMSYIDLKTNVGLLDPISLKYYKYTGISQSKYPTLIAVPAIYTDIVQYELYPHIPDYNAYLGCDSNHVYSINMSISNTDYRGPALEYCAVLSAYGNYTCYAPNYELLRINDVTKREFARLLSLTNDVVITDSNDDILNKYSDKFEIKVRLSEVGWDDTTIYPGRTIDSIKGLLKLNKRVSLGNCIRINIVTMVGYETDCVPDFSDENNPPYLSRPICSKLSYNTKKYTKSDPKVCSESVRRQLWDDCVVTLRATYEINQTTTNIKTGWEIPRGVVITPQGYPDKPLSIYHRGSAIVSNTGIIRSNKPGKSILHRVLGKQDYINKKCIFALSEYNFPGTTPELTRTKLEVLTADTQWKFIDNSAIEEYTTELSSVQYESVYQQVIGNCVNYKKKEYPKHISLPSQTKVLSSYEDYSLGYGPIRTIDSVRERYIEKTNWDDYFKAGKVVMISDYASIEPYTGKRVVFPCKTGDSTSYALEGSQSCFFLVDYTPDENGTYLTEESYCPDNSTLMKIDEIHSWGDFYRIVKQWDSYLYVSSVRMSKEGLNVTLHTSEDSGYYVPYLQDSSYNNDTLVLDILSYMFVPNSNNNTCEGKKVACTTNSTFYVPPPITTTTLPTTTVNITTTTLPPTTTLSVGSSINVHIFSFTFCITLLISILL